MTHVLTATETAELTEQPIHELARIIRADWDKVNYAAAPYLDAMRQLTNITDAYYQDSGEMVVAYFLNNAGQWRGDTARAVKAELRRRLA